MKEQEREKLALAMRNAVFGEVSTENNWSNCRESWLEAFDCFRTKAKEAGFELKRVNVE